MNETGKQDNGAPLLQVANLKKYFPITQGLLSSVAGWVKAVDDVSFTVNRGETLGLVGESGCGKTTCGRSMLKLIDPTAGKVFFKGQDVFGLKGAAMKAMRRNMQIIFQDPYSSLNPRKTVLDIVGEALAVHRIARGKALEARVAALCEQVGLSAAYINRYPHEFSGGQRQRLGIARALALSPAFIVCDEPVSALDVSIQAQVINLLIQLKEKLNLAYLFISHDLSVVKHISDRIAVMYMGRIVEIAPKQVIFNDPRHPYTEALLSAVPVPDPTVRGKRIILKGEPPSLINPPKGCPFHPRCPKARPGCRQQVPPEKQAGPDHQYRCFL